MSIMCTVYLPEGIILAADSRMTGRKVDQDEDQQIYITHYTLSDNSQKIVLLDKSKVGISFCGAMIIDGKTVADYLRIFEIEELNEGDSVTVIAQKLFNYLQGNMDTTFFVCGYDNDEQYVYGIVNGLIRRNESQDQGSGEGLLEHGATWYGQISPICRLLTTEPTTNIDWELMTLKDGIDFAEFIVDTTIKYERFMDDIQTCGGPIDILVLTKDDAFWYRHKIFKK